VHWLVKQQLSKAPPTHLQLRIGDSFLVLLFFMTQTFDIESGWAVHSFPQATDPN